MTGAPSSLLRLVLGALVLLGAALANGAVAMADGWAVLKQPCHVVFMRHSDAPGSGGYRGRRKKTLLRALPDKVQSAAKLKPCRH